MFQKAVKHASKLRMAIAGVSGSGKTFTALTLASSLGERVAVIDTENGSASKYADMFNFDVVNMPPTFHPDNFIDYIGTAEQAGYDVVIIDSITHAWSGTGGVLELKEQFAKTSKFSDYTAWKPAGEIQQRMVDAILQSRIHVIVTMRSKSKYILEEYQDRNGKTRNKPVKAGMSPQQRDGFEYEFDIMLEMDSQNRATVSKSRMSALSGREIVKPDASLAEEIAAWLSGEQMPQYADGSEIKPGASMSREVAAYEDYKSSHDGKVADNVEALRSWLKSKKSTAEQPQEQPQTETPSEETA